MEMIETTEEVLERLQRPWSVAEILGVPVDALSVAQLHDALTGFISDDQRATVLHANVHAVNLAQDLPWFREYIRSADIVFCDGAGIMLAARLNGLRIPERITYAEWMWQLAAFAVSHGHSLFLLGGRPGVAEQAGANLTKRHPGLRVLGTHHGYFDKSQASAENAHVVDAVNRVRPDIVVVGFGMPVQERWLLENRARLETKVTLTGGAVFDYVSGNLRRAPRWMTEHGLEWLGRLAIEPKRLWRRYLVGNARFLRAILKSQIDRGSSQRP